MRFQAKRLARPRHPTKGVDPVKEAAVPSKRSRFPPPPLRRRVGLEPGTFAEELVEQRGHRRSVAVASMVHGCHDLRPVLRA